jgi:tetratricopeptide (TPR) repeat protein
MGASRPARFLNMRCTIPSLAFLACYTVSAQVDSPQALLLQAEALHKQKQYAQSLAAAERLLTVPEVALAAYKLSGANLALLGRGPDAELRFQKAVELGPKDALAWYYLGFARFRIFKYREALDPLRKAIELNPHHTDSYYTLAVALEWLQEPAEAEKVYRKLIPLTAKIAGEAARTNLFLGRLLVTQSRYRDALDPLESAARLMPKSAEALKYLGRVYRQLERNEDALRVFETAVTLAPEDRELRYLLMRTYSALGKHQQADAEAKAIEGLAVTREGGK